MPNREDVYIAIDSERDYQEARAREVGTPEGEVRPHSLEEFVIYMDDYLNELKHQLSRIWTPDRRPPKVALDTLRKVTTLGVAAMEQHGAPLREDRRG